MINDARCTREIKSRIAVAKVAFNNDDNSNKNNKTHFCSKLDLNKKLVQCYIWSIAFVWC